MVIVYLKHIQFISSSTVTETSCFIYVWLKNLHHMKFIS